MHFCGGKPAEVVSFQPCALIAGCAFRAAQSANHSMSNASVPHDPQHRLHQLPQDSGRELDFAAGGGDMGALLRGFDWGATPLGSLDTWPQSLRTAVSILLGAQHPMYVAWGPQLHLLYNDGYRALLGARARHPERILGQPFHLVWAETWDQMRPTMDDALRGIPTYAEDRAFTVERNGYPETMYATFSASAIRDESGAVAGVFCVCSETTSKVVSERERDCALAELAISNQKLSLALDADAKFRTFFDQGTHFAGLMAPDGTVIEINQVALELGGYRRDSIVGRRLWECGWFKPSPELAQSIHASVAAAARGETVRREVAVYLADGNRRFADIVLAPVSGDDGSVPLIAVTGADISERRQVEERLRLLDAIGEATRVAHDPTTIMAEATRLLGQYLDVTRVAYADLEADNDCFTIRHDWTAPGAVSTVGVYSLDLFGSRARADMRQGRTLLIHDVDAELTDADGAAMFNQIDVKAIVCCPLVKGGRLVAMMAVHQATPRAWSATEVALVEAVVERCWAHIERVRGAEALRGADRRKSEFLATLAHELRNPLAPIRNGLELMRMHADGNAGGRAANPALLDNVRAMMERQLNHMVHLVNDLLDIARVSSGKLVLQARRVDLRDAIATAVETSRPLVDANRHRLEVLLPDAPLEVEVDPVRISQVVSNLLSNAAKYTPHGGRIVLAAQADTDGQALEVTVSDNGVGIAADSLGAVFDMFTQVARSLDRSNGGLGIGLSLVRRLVELHGGSVSAASAGVGQGSRFTVRLPLAHAAPPAPEASAPSQAPPARGRQLRVLVADDNADAALTLAALLDLAGHDTRIAHDGVAALAAAAAFDPHLIFLDIGMPRMDGYETARRLRAAPELAGAMLVALTGWGADEDRARSRAAGFDRHLLKPALPDQVEAVLAEAVARS